jgi:transcription antitermination factor NusG
MLELDAATQPLVDATQPEAPKHVGCIRLQGPRWAVLATHSQAETWAEANLRQRGYTAFVPRYTARKRDPVLATLTRYAIRPLFPGYVFALHNPRDPWRPLRYCPGVKANLLGGASVQYARAGAVEALRATEHVRRGVYPVGAQWRPGAAVRVAIGVFAGLPGVVMQLDADIALVSVLFLGQFRDVALSLDCIEPREAS